MMEDKEISHIAMYVWQLATTLECEPADLINNLILAYTFQGPTERNSHRLCLIDSAEELLAEIDRLSNLEIDVVFLSSFVVKTGKGMVQDNG